VEQDFLCQWFSRMPLADYPTLRQVDELFDRTEKARDWVYRGLRKAGKTVPHRYSVFELARAIGLVHPKIRESIHFTGEVRSLIQQATLLVGKPPLR